MAGTSRLQRLAFAWLLAYVMTVGYVLLNPSAAVPNGPVGWVARLAVANGLPSWLTSSERIEFMINVLILVPVPILGSLIWARTTWRDWTAYAFVISAGVELAQGLLLSERAATFVDVVANTLGAGAGAVLVVLMKWAYSRRAKPPQSTG